ncbi:hypothetical protein BDA99DRAFT_535081 [Phascolomyces articulosus]|uniref:Cyclin n=1 Tax=Phascolomyces articulosus TaxID=60185 RepID=A0AAD5K4J0_9FUNG|nr:hypothetical protein BDA99DRAFT_535081 [Phascolomyces articulosus]
MQLRLEPVQPYTLFPPPWSTTNNTTPSSSSTSSYYYQQQQQPHSQQVFPPLPNPYRDALLPPLISTTATTSNNNTKRLSAFEPVIANSSCTSPTTPLPPVFVDDIPRLADFASSIIYLMWHARKKMTLKSVNQAYLIDATKPSPAFKKFCLQVLTATQLSQNAVYLALKYICALLRTNPTIEGADGSEYRLFTVALMLANKFLDDSTFTNKTWSDVSGMKLHDLNTMEAEFLEAIGYGLFIREYEFDQWRHAVDGCRAHVQRMTMDHAAVDNTTLMRDVLIRLGLYQETFLEQQQQAVWEAAFEASRLQLENNQRQHHLNLYAKAHSLVPPRPQRHTAPPPPIGRYGDPPFHYYQQHYLPSSNAPPPLPPLCTSSTSSQPPSTSTSQQQRRSSMNPPGLPSEPMYKKQLPPPGLNTSYYFEYRPFESSSWATTTTNPDYYL